MPFTSVSVISGLSQYWTHKNIVSEAMILTGTTDNTLIQTDNVRVHLNVCLSYLAQQLKAMEDPWYGIWLNGTLEPQLHAGLGLEWIDLNDPILINVLTPWIPSDWLSKITRISLMDDNSSSSWVGNCTPKDINSLTMLNSFKNMAYRQSVCWCHHGVELLFFVGDDIATTANAKTGRLYDISNQQISLVGFRNPMLDNMVNPTFIDGTIDSNNKIQNYNSPIDLSDNYVNLLIKMIMIKIYDQLKEQRPEQLEQEITQDIVLMTKAKIQQTIDNVQPNQG